VKPNALPLGQWKKWDDALKASHPVVFWYTEEFLDGVQNFINKPLDVLNDLRYWGYNRFVSRPHLLDTKLKPGAYHEVNNRILHGLFETLVDFVEVEKAWMCVAWDTEARKKYHIPWYKRVPYFLRWKPWRCPEAGIAHLEWEMALVHDYDYLPEEERADKPGYNEPTPQAVGAREQFFLYNWWKNVRPLRKDPMDASGWSDHCEAQREAHGDVLWVDSDDETEEERLRGRTALDLCTSIEGNYDKQDEDMLIRLIKIRQHLWT
jgi:hypothetical protein